MLKNWYKKRLDDLSVLHNLADVNWSIHSTRLREKILSDVDDLKAKLSGREYILFYDDSIEIAFKIACDNYSDAIQATKVAKIIRENTLSKNNEFSGKFDSKCQENATDPLLLSFINMILYGSLENDVQKPTQAALSICQLIAFNTKSKRASERIVHQRKSETPLPIYMALYIHSLTRERALIDKLHDLGLSISYDRLLRISSGLCEASIDQFVQDNVVCPNNLQFGLFTTGAYDNIDHNSSNTTTEKSFHGTSISLFQHPLPKEIGGVRNLRNYSNNVRSKAVPPMFDKYTNIIPKFLVNKQPDIPAVSSDQDFSLNYDILQTEERKEIEWLHNTFECTSNNEISWSAYHEKKESKELEKSILSILPLFPDDSKSVTMIIHAIGVISDATEFLNPGQVPVVVMDQPLYTLTKTIQWDQPLLFGEDKFVVTFGSLHIEQGMLKVLGKYLEGSGWTDCLVKAEIATSGTADSFLNVSHIKKSRLFHQITAAVLFQLMHEAYLQENLQNQTFDEWRSSKEKLFPMFRYWSNCLDMELLMLMFVRAHRSASYDLYINSLKAFLPWFFSVDFYNYSRWLPVFIRDLSLLPQQHPKLYEAFKNGLFVVQKANRKFSAIGTDEAHEQNNGILKGISQKNSN